MSEPYGYMNRTQDLLSEAATVAAAGIKNYTPGTAPNTPVDVNDTGKAYVQVRFTGSAGGSGLVTFRFAAIGHSEHDYPTLAQFSRSVPQNGAAEVIDGFVIDTTAFTAIALLSVQNADTAAGITGVQALVSYKL